MVLVVVVVPTLLATHLFWFSVRLCGDVISE